METTMDTLMITIESASKDASKQVDTLVTKLGQLQTALKNVSGQSKNLSDLSSAIKTVASSSGVKSVGKDLGTMSDQLENLELSMSALGDPIKTIESADSVTKKYKTSIGQLVEISEKEVGGHKRIKVTLTEVADETKKNASAFDLLQSKISGTILKTKLFISSLTKIVKGIISFTEKAADYEESLNLFTVTMGDQAKQGVEWLEKFSNALYLDPTEVMQYMGSFNSLIKGLGTASDKSYLMSKDLTQLTYDLASFKNIKPETAFEKLQSAISGEIEPLRNVGVALSENTLQELAYSLGLEANVRDLTEAQKAQLRYIQIMKSSTEWQTDMGRTLVTPANALRVLTQEFKMLGRAIGRIFIPIVMAAMPYIIAFSQLLTDLANRIASFLGYKIADIDYSGLTSGLEDLSNGVSDIGDSADKTKKKINTMLAPFDELNVVQEQVKKTSSGLEGLSGGDLGVDLPEYDALANLTKDMDERVEKAKKNLKNLIPIVTAIGVAFGTWKLTRGISNFLSTLPATTSGVSILSKALTKIKSLGFVKILTAILKPLTTISGLVVGLITSVRGIKDVYNVTKKLGSGFKSCSQSALLLAGSVAEVTAGTTLLGLAIGGPVGAGVGALTGLFISGISAIKGYKDGLQELAKSKVFGDINISTDTFSKTLNNLKFSFSETNNVIQRYTESLTSLGSSFEESANQVDNYLARFQYLGESISGETGEAFKESLNTLFADANAIIEEGANYSIELWATSFKSMNTITTEEQGNILQIIQENQTYVKSEMQNLQNGINDIWTTGINTRGYLTNEELASIESMLNKIRELTNGEMSKTQADIEYYKTLFANKNYKLDEETYSNYKKAREKYEKEQLEIIRNNYTQQYADAENNIKILEKRKETADKTERERLTKQIKTLKEAQKKLNDDRLTSEEELKDKLNSITDNITEGLKTKYTSLNKETSKSAKEQRKIIESIFKDLNIDTSSLKKSVGAAGKTCALTFAQEFNRKQLTLTLNPNSKIGFTGASIPFNATTRGYADGGYPTRGDLFFANENGVPEMVGRIGNQTAVANQDQITTSITNALLQALNQYDFGNNQPNRIVVNIGGKKLYDGYGDYINSETDRYGTTTLNI